ncbi:mannitol dehydrogenase family protein [Leucobacter sp. CSA1]|uniref:Mannitol-1-phosphate 5-dehydrogenase n=1 Tax=Leucobacter chromiisoli TaxID=2796471 RepID=A0A934Q636_9MICO|nr:mannitol dehydrogenase family protein [Leucobacter chromiisoli]MBK0419055.1 mannitol dehydrogenase family protein [Leucobacter chromiisoli]
MELNDGSLERLPERIARPRYDRAGLAPGIVHIGVGNFMRAHHALYLDDLMNRGLALDWAISGIGLISPNAPARTAMGPQDCLYTLTEKHPDGRCESRVVGSISEYHYAPDDPELAISRIARPETRIVSLTITEGGYDVDDRTGEFLGRSAIVRADLEAERCTRSAFGLVLEAMRIRRDRGDGGLTVMSCDNMQGNGRVAQAAFLGFARRRDPDLAAWMERNLSFPNSMVDRVAPRTSDADRAHLLERYGLDDRWPVTAEPFRQWVLEDDFAAGRPPYEEAGVEIVDDVVPYELMKLRLANGTHQALAYFGRLLGHTYVHEAIVDPDIRPVLLRYIDEEAIPTLAPIPGQDFRAFGRTVLERFGNPQLQDTLVRICEETSDRIPKFLLPVVFDRLGADERADVCAAVVASWARYAEGVGDDGEPFEVRDPLREQLMERAGRQGEEPLAFLGNREIFGDLADRPEFVGPYLRALTSLRERGARETLGELKRPPSGG